MFLRKETFFFVSEMVAKLRIEVEFTHDKFERQWKKSGNYYNIAFGETKNDEMIFFSFFLGIECQASG